MRDHPEQISGCGDDNIPRMGNVAAEALPTPTRMAKPTPILLLAVSCAIALLYGCKSRDEIKTITIDLNQTAPIGYEICAIRPPKLARRNVELLFQMPSRLEIPPDQQDFGAKYIEFRPGRHEVDLYKNLHSARLLYTKGELALEAGVPTIRARLDMAKLSKGTYVLGISGDPFFAYCTVDLQ